MKIFNGLNEALLLDELIINKVKLLDYVPKLAIIQLGDDPVSNKYVKLKSNLASKLGIGIELHKFKSDTSLNSLENSVNTLAKDKEVHGIIVQLPLPKLEYYCVIDLIPKQKDVDHLNSNYIYTSDNEVKYSPVVRSFIHFAKFIKLDLVACETVIIGDGKLVGKPISEYLKFLNANYRCMLNYANNTAISCDLLVLGTGLPNLIKGECLNKSTNVIDFGTSSHSGTIIGDFDINSDTSKVNYLSTSPGGMGPLVIRYLFMNLIGI